MSGRWIREWFEVRARDIVVGDLYANHATVTEVVRGPGHSSDPDDDFLKAKRGEVAFRCGEGFGWKGKSDRWLVVGREGEWVDS